MLKSRGLVQLFDGVAANFLRSSPMLLANNNNSLFLSPPTTHLAFAKRGFPARGTKSKRLFFDFEHLNEITEGGNYTHLPLRIRRMGGRNREGRKVNIHIGGGVKFDYFMLHLHRRGPIDANQTYDERVIEIRQDPNRTPHLALVAGAEGKRWIYATRGMKAGQIVSTTCHIPKYPAPGVEGNAYPIGALSEGTVVNCVELFPSEKAHVCITEAGSSGEIVRHQGDFTVVRMPNRHEYALQKKCMATVGQLSHEDYRSKIFGSPQMHRRFGFRMSGGDYHKKDGYQGRKGRRLPPVRTLENENPAPAPKQKFTFTKKQLSALYGNAAVPKLVAEFNNVVRL